MVLSMLSKWFASVSLFTSIQEQLNFTLWSKLYPQFTTTTGLGRTAYIGTVLGIIWGIHFIMWIQLALFHFGILAFPYQPKHTKNHDDDDDLMNNNQQQQQQQQTIVFMIWQWCTYVMCLCAFHLLEFFVTLIYNPTQATSDSYLINHSTTYTTAAILSWLEFWIRFLSVLLFRRRSIYFVPYFQLSMSISYAGFLILLTAQYIRSMAMATAGESFNHMIQTSKKENHVLVTHGIYRTFRHPSYVGFFYWSVSTQLILGNVLHTLLYTAASWTFFNRRIQYEEESLHQFFPNEYPKYVARTYMGIPFIKSQYHYSQSADDHLTVRNAKQSTSTGPSRKKEK